MTEETRKQDLKSAAEIVRFTAPSSTELRIIKEWATQLVAEGIELGRKLGEKAGRSEKKDSLSTKLVHETE